MSEKATQHASLSLVARRLWSLVPSGGTLPEDAWRKRYSFLLGLTWFHAVIIALSGPVLGYSWDLTLEAIFRNGTVLHTVGEGLIVALFAILGAWKTGNRTFQATAIGFGLMSSSAILVHLSGGYIELHFHFFVMLAFLALLQEWIPYGLAILFVALHHGVVGVLWPEEVYNHTAAFNAPWTWAGIHAFFVLWASVGTIIAWRFNEAAFAETQRHLERIGALRDIDHAVSSTLELHPVLDLLLEKIALFFPHSWLTVRLADEVNAKLELAAWRNLTQEELREAVQLSAPELATAVFKSKNLMTINDLRTDPRSHNIEMPQRFGLRSYLGVPLIAEDRALGALAILTKESYEFKPEEIEFVSMLAGRAAVAIHNAQLYGEISKLASDLAKSNRDLKRSEEIQRIVKEVSQDITVLDPESVLQKIAERARAVLMVDQADARLLTEQGPQYITPQSVAPASGDWSSWPRWQWIRENRSPLMIPDITQDASFPEGPGGDRSGMRGYLAVPIFSRNGDAIGILRALSRQPRVFTQAEIDLLQQLANGAAIALENARLLEETKQRAQEQEALNAIAAATSQSLHVDEILRIALDRVLAVTGRDKGYIRLSDPVSGELRLVAHRGISEGHVENLLRGRTPGGKGDQVLESGRSLVVNDTEGTLLKKATIEEGNRSIAWIPMKARGKVVGILNVSTSQPIPFTPSEVNLLEAIGSVIGNAVENGRLFEETDARAREMSVLYDVVATVNQSLDLDKALEEVIQKMMTIFSFDATRVYLFDSQTDELHLRAALDKRPESQHHIRVFRPGQGNIGRAFATGEPIIFADVHDDPRYQDFTSTRTMDRSGFSFFAAFPIKRKLRSIGVMSCIGQSPRSLSREEVRLLNSVADQIGVAFENSRLYEETKKQAEELKKTNSEVSRRENIQVLLKELSQDIALLSVDELLKKLAEKARGFLRVDVCSVRVKGEGTQWKLVATSGVDPGRLRGLDSLQRNKRLEWILENRKPLVISDVANGSPISREDNPLLAEFRSYLGVPLLSRAGEVLGFIRALTYQPRKYSSEEVDLLQQLANGAAIAIENARLLEETKQRAQEQVVLNVIAAATSESLHLDELLKIALDKVLEVTGREKGYIRFKDPATGELKLGAHRGISEEYVRTLLQHRTRGGKSDQVFESGEVLVINDPEGTILKEETRQEGSRSLIWVPLKARGRVVGILNVATSQAISFTPREVELLQAIGNVMGVALENARLFGETQTSLERVRALSDIEATITSTLDLRALLDGMLEKVERLLPNFGTAVRLLNPKTGELGILTSRNIDQELWTTYKSHGGSGLSKAVFESRAPIVISDTRNDPRVRDPKFVLQGGMVSYLGLPLIAKSEILGVLSFFSKEKAHAFTNEEIDFLSTLARQAAMAIQNSQLYEQTRKQALELETSNRVKDEFLSVMSHELRTPLSAVMGYSALMQDGLYGEISPEQATALAIMEKQTKHLLKMIGSILDATKIEAGAALADRHEVDLKSLLDELQSTYNGSLDKNLTLVWDYDSHFPRINTDGGKLAQILQNLINNAIKFTQEGHVTLSVRCLPEANAVEFKVSDTGIGIAKEALPIIFEKFRQIDNSETRPYGGVGLGLHIVKEFTKMLGGEVKADSDLGKGSTFTVTLPCEKAPSEVSNRQTPAVNGHSWGSV